MKLACEITIFQGNFASQPLVFAHLLDQRQDLDLDKIEVVQANVARRLAAWFSPDVKAIIEARITGNTLVLVMPGAGGTLQETALLKSLGMFSGTVTRAMIEGD